MDSSDDYAMLGVAAAAAARSQNVDEVAVKPPEAQQQQSEQQQQQQQQQEQQHNHFHASQKQQGPHYPPHNGLNRQLSPSLSAVPPPQQQQPAQQPLRQQLPQGTPSLAQHAPPHGHQPTAVPMPRPQHGHPEQQQPQHHSFHAQPMASRHLQHHLKQLQQYQPPQPHHHLRHHQTPQLYHHQPPHLPQHAPQRLQDLPQTPGIATTHVGKYTLYTTIGEGAFGKVKLGINRDTKERVAVKIMDKKEIREQDLSAQVRREIYIMRSLRHKHIVRMYEVLTSDTKLYIVMELVTGGELFERLEKYGRVDESLARHFFHQLVDGVDFCHKSGVAHRDLKPENLLLDANGDIKITDFGFSSMRGNDVNCGLLYTQCGTPDYCAPEIIEGADEGYNGAKVDVWSCGIILYALLVGALPFQEQETDRLYDLILACDVHYPSLISPLAKDLLSRLLVRDPLKRLTLADIKRHEWFLIDYAGDDARLLKKPAFYNKVSTNVNTSGSRSSTPSASGRATPKRDTHSAQYQDVEHPSGEPQGLHLQVRDIPQPQSHTHVPSQTQDDVQRSPNSTDHPGPSGPNVSGRVDRDPDSGEQELRQGLAHSQSPRQASDPKLRKPTENIDASSRDDEIVSQREPPPPGSAPVANDAVRPSVNNYAHADSRVETSSGRVAAMIRAHESQLSPVDEGIPPSYSVFTRVEDRPATPASTINFASKQLPQGTNQAAPRSVPQCLDAVTSDLKALNIENDSASTRTCRSSGSPPAASGKERKCLSVESGRCDDDAPCEGSTTVTQLEADVIPTVSQSSDEEENDSVEDYVNKPVPMLSLPTADARFMRHQTAQEIRHDSTPQTSVQRHRSDAGAHSLLAGHGPRQVSVPLSSNPGTQVSQLPTASPHTIRSASPAAAVIGSIGARAGSPFRRGVGPGPHAAAHHETRGSLAHRPLRLPSEGSRPSTSPVSSSSSAAGPHGIGAPVSPFNAGQTAGPRCTSNSLMGVPWHDTRAAVRSSSEELSNSTRFLSSEMIWFGPHAEQLSRRMWYIFDRWRSLADEPASPHASQELRVKFRSILSDIAALESADEKLCVYEQFMTLFGMKGLNITDGRGDDVECGNYDHHAGVLSGRAPTDLSSDEDGGSWSPVYEGTQPRSDFGRRREISDLLTKWIGKLSSREDSADDALGSEDGGNSMDLGELQRLIRQHHGGRDDSNLAEEIDRLMKNPEPVDSGGYSLNGSASDAPLSLSKLQPARTRSGDSYLQHTRWASPPLPASSGPPSGSAGGRVFRSMVPADYVPCSFSDAAANGRTDQSAGIDDAGGENVRAHERASRGRNAHMYATGSSGGSVAPLSMKRPGRKQPDMASSMGLDNVEYYGPDRGGVSSKVKGVLLQIKGKNRRLVESSTCFTSSYEPDDILKVLSGILEGMGAHVTLKKETRRKMKVRLTMADDNVLVAGIELTVGEDAMTKVSFKRSRADRGRTNTLAFTEFYELVREQFTREVQPRGSRRHRSGIQPQSRRGEGKPPHSMHLEQQHHTSSGREPTSSSQPHIATRSRTPGSNSLGLPVRASPRAASDMR